MMADHKILDGRVVAKDLNQEIGNDVGKLSKDGFQPKLVSISIGGEAATKLYVRNQSRVAKSVGIAFDELIFPDDVTIEKLRQAIGELNADRSVTGIIIQRPVSQHISIRELQSAVDPKKDVEGMYPLAIGNIVYNDLAMGPCTALAALELLKRTKLGLKGLEVVVIGHSEIVGKAIAFLLMSEGATVTVCHQMTRNVRIHSRQADAVIVAVGKPNLVDGEMIKRGAALIDIGINQVIDGTGKSAVVGDAEFESCHIIAGWITPVPGGVGPVTVSKLMRNTVTAANLQQRVRVN